MSLFSRFIVSFLPLVPKPIVGKVAKRYVAGETRDQALQCAQNLRGAGITATIGLLGEEVTERSRAESAVQEYVHVLEALAAPATDTYISVKPTLLGLRIDETFCLDNMEQLAVAAARHGTFVRIDMEDRTTTDASLRLFRALRERHDNVGIVLQAYMRRTLADIAALPPNSNVRLCKGIYIEPRRDAWKGYDTVRRNFVASLEKLIAHGAYPAIATHDEYLVCASIEALDRAKLSPDQYEFQMLLGVDEELRDLLVAGGHPLRVYIPYGASWYEYSMRRLRENPEVAGHVLRATLGIQR